MNKTKFQLTWGTDNKQIRMDISTSCQWGKTKCKEDGGAGLQLFYLGLSRKFSMLTWHLSRHLKGVRKLAMQLSGKRTIQG